MSRDPEALSARTSKLLVEAQFGGACVVHALGLGDEGARYGIRLR